MLRSIIILVQVLSTALFVNLSRSSRILLMPCPYRSHVNFFSVTAKHLQGAGHEVRVLTLDTHRALVDRLNVESIAYPVVEGADMIQFDDVFEKMVFEMTENPVKFYTDLAASTNALCEGVNRNTTLIGTLEDFDADIVLIDGFVRCFYSIPYRLGVRYITMTARHDPWNSGIPAMPSVEPLWSLGKALSANSSIWERFSSLVGYIAFAQMMFPSSLDDSLISRYSPSKPPATIRELFYKSEMWFVNLETVCLDVPRIYGHHYQLVAGLSLEPAKALPPDLEQFVAGSANGFVVLSFGSGLKNIPKEMLSKMIRAFEQIDIKVIARHAGEVPGDEVPANMKLMPWIPQNDLLGHPRVRAFITHGGGNGQLEALYHAVPMITIPIIADQFYNAARVARKGFGITLDRNEFTSDEFVDAIRKVAFEEQTRENIRRCSERFRSMPTAQERIVFWVEHVIQFGGDHLKPLGMYVPMWKMFMLDIVALVGLAALFLYTFILCCCVRIRYKSTRTTFISKKYD